jgi:hypothetical protein
MAVIFSILALPGPHGSLQEARLYAPAGATVADLALAESPAQAFGGSLPLDPPPPDDAADPYQVEVRQVTSHSPGTFDASTTITLSRGVYGWLWGGEWLDSAPDASGVEAAGVSYLTVAEANALAARLPALTWWAAATDDQKAAALAQATIDVDSVLRYQGRRYAADQVLEFPRVAYESSRAMATWWPGGQAGGAMGPVVMGNANLSPDTPVIWDWDAATKTAVVPAPVLRAVVWQADAVLNPTRQRRLADQAEGLASQSVGSLSESYRPGTASILCRQAESILSNYRLRSGRIL